MRTGSMPTGGRGQEAPGFVVETFCSWSAKVASAMRKVVRPAARGISQTNTYTCIHFESWVNNSR